MSNNPYESPSTAAFEETRRARAVLYRSEQPVVRKYLIRIRMISLVLIGFGIAVALIGPLLGTNANRSVNPVVASVSVLVGAALVACGVFQFRRNLIAISIVGVLAAGLALLVFWGALWSSLSIASLRQGLNHLFSLMFVFGLLWMFAFIPAWVAIQSWGWRMRGIDLADLEQMRYDGAGDFLDPPPPPTF
jgi:hypothetical protein